MELRRSRWMARGIASALVLALVAAACGGDDPAAPEEAPLAGTWTGTYGTGESSTGFEFIVVVFDADSLGTLDGPGTDPITGGTYTLDGTAFSATYSYLVSGLSYWLEAEYDDGAGRLTGTWGSDGEVTPSGQFVVTRE